MNNIIILTVLFFASSSIAFKFDGGITLNFVGSNSGDYKILTNTGNFAAVKGTKYFNVNRPTVVYAFGWNADFTTVGTQTIIKAYLARGNTNIIVVDWSKYTSEVDYPNIAQVVKNASLYVVGMMRQMQNSGYNLTTFHLVGHSLGGQLLGRVGNNYNALYNFKFSRITGLDPAGPLFSTNYTIDISVIDINIISFPTLSKNDAKFVDIMHTDAGGLGSGLSTGHMDFWPNGGELQAGCGLCNPFLDNCLTCSHSRAWKYYAESLSYSTPKFMAKKCNSGTKPFNSATCTGPSTASMGYYANQYTNFGNYYLSTYSTTKYSK